MKRFYFTILYTLFLISLIGCQTVSKKIEDTTTKEEQELSKWLNKSEEDLKSFYGQPDEVEYEDNLLTVKTKDVKRSEEKEGDEVIHRGISQRSFARSFTIADDVKVNGAELKDGLLTISCEKIIPEIKKKRLIEIK